MLTVPNHHLLLDVPRNVLQEALLHDFSRHCSEADHALFENGCSICLSPLFGYFPQAFENYNGLTTILASSLSTVRCSLSGPMDFNGLNSRKSSLTWLQVVLLLEPCFSARIPKRPYKWRLRQRRHYVPQLFLWPLSLNCLPHLAVVPYFLCSAFYYYCSGRSSSYYLSHLLQVSTLCELDFSKPIPLCLCNLSEFLICCLSLLLPLVCCLIALGLGHEFPAYTLWSPHKSACHSAYCTCAWRMLYLRSWQLSWATLHLRAVSYGILPVTCLKKTKFAILKSRVSTVLLAFLIKESQNGWGWKIWSWKII